VFIADQCVELIFQQFPFTALLLVRHLAPSQRCPHTKPKPNRLHKFRVTWCMKPFLMGEITPQPGGRHTRPSFSAGVFLVHHLDRKRGDFFPTLPKLELNRRRFHKKHGLRFPWLKLAHTCFTLENETAGNRSPSSRKDGAFQLLN
jgi:hypothetical protein